MIIVKIREGKLLENLGLVAHKTNLEKVNPKKTWGASPRKIKPLTGILASLAELLQNMLIQHMAPITSEGEKEEMAECSCILTMENQDYPKNVISTTR